MKKYHIITFGCQMNEHDSETIAGMLAQQGMEPVLDKKEADIVIINTCSVRENADKRFFGTDAKGLYMLDQELSQRIYSAPSLVL